MSLLDIKDILSIFGDKLLASLDTDEAQLATIFTDLGTSLGVSPALGLVPGGEEVGGIGKSTSQHRIS